jgi:hypothetical protein
MFGNAHIACANQRLDGFERLAQTGFHGRLVNDV